MAPNRTLKDIWLTCEFFMSKYPYVYWEIRIGFWQMYVYWELWIDYWLLYVYQDLQISFWKPCMFITIPEYDYERRTYIGIYKLEF